jgi:hypothetical protein
MIVVVSNRDATAVRKREDVPAKTASTIPGNFRTDVSPITTSSLSICIDRPESRITFSTTRASSPDGIPEIREDSFDNMAHTSARFATLFDPGTDTTASSGPTGGCNSIDVTTTAG